MIAPYCKKGIQATLKGVTNNEVKYHFITFFIINKFVFFFNLRMIHLWMLLKLEHCRFYKEYYY